MLPVTAEHERHRGARHRSGPEPVEEQLEQTGVSGLVRRARDHDQVAGLDGGDHLGDAGIGPVQQRSAYLGEIDAEVGRSPRQPSATMCAAWYVRDCGLGLPTTTATLTIASCLSSSG